VAAAPHAHHHHEPGHSHAPSAGADRRWIAVALALIVGFMFLEVVAGLLADSLALLSDAAHMLTDAGALALALVAARLATRPPGGRYTFGLGRAEILSAQVNGAALLVLAGVIAWEALQRLGDPPHVEGAIVLVVGLAGAAVNVAAAWALSRADGRSLNVQGARAHVLVDLYGSLGAALAGLLVLTTGFARADTIVALLVAALMVHSGWSLLSKATRVLLEGSPGGLDPQAIGNALAAQPGVSEVHDLHVWEVTSGFPALSAHVLVPAGEDCHGRRAELEHLLAERFGIEHSTLQVEHEPDAGLLDIASTAVSAPARAAGGTRSTRPT
jgi:cobalt-zinc-cadmium efflux system protein